MPRFYPFSVLAANRRMAEDNLALKPRLEESRNALIEIHNQLASKQDQLQSKQRELESKRSNFDRIFLFLKF